MVISHYWNSQNRADRQYNKNQYQIGQNYPNPFNDITTIPMTLEMDSKVIVQVYDLTGRLIATPVTDNFISGKNNLALSKTALKLSSGYYIYSTIIENEKGVFTESKKMIVE